MKGFALACLVTIFCGPAMRGAKGEEPANSDVDRRSEQAALLFEQGHTPESKKIYESLLSTLREQPPTPRLGFVLNGLSKIAGAEGNYNGAILLAKQSAEVYHHVGDAGGEAHSRNNQGIAEIQMGSYPAAQETLELALALSRRAKDFEDQVQILNNLGSAFFYPGRYSEALHRYDEAMELVDQSATAKWSPYWRQITSFNQATLYQRLGRYERAMQIYRQVGESSKDLTASDRAHLFANLGALYRRLGDPYKALEVYGAAQKLYSEQHDAGGELTVTKNIGIVYALDMEDLNRAQEIFRSAISLATKTRNRREEMQAHLYLGETLFRGAMLSPARAEFERSRLLADELGTTEERWKSLYGLGQIEQSSGNFVAAEADYREAISTIEKTRGQLQLTALRSEFFADKRDAYDALIALLLQKSDISEAFSFLERSRARNFQDRLQTASRKPGGPLLTIDRVRASLAPEAALLEFWTSGDQVGLIWCTRERSGMTLKRLSATDASTIHAFLDGMPNVLSEDWQNKTRALDPLLPEGASFLQGVRHVLIVPDGWISYVPFDLLHVAGSNSLLMEQSDISYLPSAALLLRTRAADKWLNAPWTPELMAFGDPSLDSSESVEVPGRLERTGGQRLPFSAEEIRGIADLAHGRSQLFLRENDLKKNFLGAAVSSAHVLHVSTHAFADGDSPENSRLLFSPATPGGGPDYLFLRELYDLDLSHIRLATISACDTEKGKIIRGEGVQAFSRALLSAGASSSLTTLWRVDDEPTAEFMKQFYYLVLKQHKPKAEALRLVKLKFLHSNGKLADPQLWAAFVLNGDGATPLPRVLSWTEIGLLIGVLAAVLLLAADLWSRRRINRQNRSISVVTQQT